MEQIMLIDCDFYEMLFWEKGKFPFIWKDKTLILLVHRYQHILQQGKILLVLKVNCQKIIERTKNMPFLIVWY